MIESVLNRKDFRLWSLLAGALFSLIALLPQLDLWIARGTSWNGTYAISAADEPAYAAYLQSIIDGKPRRNSPYSGKFDTAETPQKESLFSIQFFTTYPLAFISRALGISSSTAMILLSVTCGFASAFSVFWLIYLLAENARLSFVGTTVVLLCGWLSAGSDNAFSLILYQIPTFEHTPLLFLRRTNPAVSFPVLFLFFVCVWKFLIAKNPPGRIAAIVCAVLCFGALGYSYFFHWTTALAWILCLSILWAVFQTDHFRRNWAYFVGMVLALFISIIPYFILLSNRSGYMDSIQLLVFTHAPDLWRTPELISYLAMILLLLSYRFGWLDLERSKYIFLLSISLIAPMVFNQQILTGRSLQPYHYQLYASNYISSVPLLAVILMLIVKNARFQTVRTAFLMLTCISAMIFTVDIIWGNNYYHDERIWLDELKPVADRIKSVSEDNGLGNSSAPSITMTFDLSHPRYPNSSYLPSLSSQAILWSVYSSAFPDVDGDEDLQRLSTFIYYHGLNGEQLKNSLKSNFSLSIGFFGMGRVYPHLTTNAVPITDAELNAVVSRYETFRSNFSYETAKLYALSFVVVRNGTINDLSAIDRWYERDSGEVIGPYTLYRVHLRSL